MAEPSDAACPRCGAALLSRGCFDAYAAGLPELSLEDASAHYDLGVAYREMGLLAEAIAELQLAAKDPSRECVSHAMIGRIFRDRGDESAAIDAFIRALHAPGRTPAEEIAINYEIADSYQARGSTPQAHCYFTRVANLDPEYQDPRGSVAARLRALGPDEPPDDEPPDDVA